MKTSKGSTLIELMIVVAIISILAAVAMLAYQDYIVRTQVTEGLSLTQGAKNGVTEEYSSTGIFPTDNLEAGLALPGSITGRYVTSVTVGNRNGEIAVLFGGDANAAIAGQELLLQATDAGGSLSWDCNSPSIEPRHLPSSCR